jgi:hypothetical protein
MSMKFERKRWRNMLNSENTGPSTPLRFAQDDRIAIC